ncbi:MAG: bifunctional 4-hydroxy-2-oxoglutarate aldolase/2-dehydro-3-deoxy-phosphogluconate aldolase [Microcella sp.]|uniref:bifunctional 4-hydroxy-2-oxoglutarate aldolase/2-dehydro-3-deoxy-phosphogluconate aldolase n=1 Tax=Microcella sp. TaxID=1913979 RepID=UPI0033163C5F
MTDAHSAEAANAWFDSALGLSPVMAVLRGLDPATTVRLAQLAWDSGFENVEIPIESQDALPSLAAALSAGAERGAAVGAGTIVEHDQMETAARMGAAYFVSPGLDPGLVRDAWRMGLPFLPGVSTASEILAARALGLRWLKAFPVSVLGPAWVSAMRGPFPDLRLVATGGMNGDNADVFLRAGCSVVGVGGALDDPRQLALLQGLRGGPTGALDEG